MRSLGWAEYLNVKMTPDRKMMTASYWVYEFLIIPSMISHPSFYSRPAPTHPQAQGRRPKLPLLGGTLTISIVETHGPMQAGSGPARSPKARALATLQHKAKFGDQKSSDQVEGLRFQVRWEPNKGVLGVSIPTEDGTLSGDILHIVCPPTALTV